MHRDRSNEHVHTHLDASICTCTCSLLLSQCMVVTFISTYHCVPPLSHAAPSKSLSTNNHLPQNNNRRSPAPTASRAHGSWWHGCPRRQQRGHGNAAAAHAAHAAAAAPRRPPSHDAAAANAWCEWWHDGCTPWARWSGGGPDDAWARWNDHDATRCPWRAR